MPDISIPWGAGELPVSLPAEWTVRQVVEPSIPPAPSDWPEHLARALARPEASPPLGRLLAARHDGRIAIVNPGAGKMGVPHATANPRDWRLFQELAAQADVMITTGSHLRHRMEGDAQEISTGDDPRFADLRAWRKARNLAPRADLAVVSRSLDFPYPTDMAAGWRKVGQPPAVVKGASEPEGKGLC